MRRTHRKQEKQGQRGGILLKLIVLLGVVVFCLLLYAVHRPVLRFLAESWIVEDPLNKADVLIVLSGDNFFGDRATRAAELFREGKAPLVVASGKRLRPNAGVAELMEHNLVERGVPKNKVLRFAHDADNTKEEAEALVQLAKTKKWHKAIVVTSNYQTRRTRYIFHRVFPQDIEVHVASARDGDFDPQHWWEKRKSTKEFVHEMAGMFVAVWELRGGSAKRAQTQGIVGLRGLSPQAVV